MLSNRQNVVYKSTVVSAPLASVDICDVDTSDDDDDDNNDNNNINNNGFATMVASNKQCAYNQNSNQTFHNEFVSDKMLTASINGNRRLSRPSTINLKPTIGSEVVVKVNDKDITDGCFQAATDDSEHSSSGQGINIQFQDIIYRARREISWDRCKYYSLFILLKRNEK